MRFAGFNLLSSMVGLTFCYIEKRRVQASCVLAFWPEHPPWKNSWFLLRASRSPRHCWSRSPCFNTFLHLRYLAWPRSFNRPPSAQVTQSSKQMTWEATSLELGQFCYIFCVVKRAFFEVELQADAYAAPLQTPAKAISTLFWRVP